MSHAAFIDNMIMLCGRDTMHFHNGSTALGRARGSSANYNGARTDRDGLLQVQLVSSGLRILILPTACLGWSALAPAQRLTAFRGWPIREVDGGVELGSARLDPLDGGVGILGCQAPSAKRQATAWRGSELPQSEGGAV